MNTGDSKKIGIIIDDKSEDLFKKYIREKDLESSINISEFFFQLYTEGFDLQLKDLNNAAYVFLTSDNLEAAYQLFREAERKIKVLSYGHNELSTVGLLYYNMGIVYAKKEQYSNAIEEFNKCKMFCKEKDQVDHSAAALVTIIEGENESISFVEEKAENINKDGLKYHVLAEQYILLLGKYIK